MADIVTIVLVILAVLAAFFALLFQSPVRALVSATLSALLLSASLFQTRASETGILLWLAPVGLVTLLWMALLLNLSKAERGERRRSVQRGAMLIAVLFVAAPIYEILKNSVEQRVFTKTIPLHDDALTSAAGVIVLVVSLVLCVVVARRTP